jgi:hypothetical protein
LGRAPIPENISGRKLTQVLNSVGSVLVHQETAGVRVRRHLAHAEGVLYGMELGSVTLKINTQNTLSVRGVTSGVSKVFPGKRRLKLSRGEPLYFRWAQFGIQSLRGCLFLLFGSTLVVKIKKTQESTPSISVMPKKNNRDKENISLLPVVSPLSSQRTNLKSEVSVCLRRLGVPPDPPKEFQVGEPSVAESRLYSELGRPWCQGTALVPGKPALVPAGPARNTREYVDGFSSLVNHNKKGKKCAVFCFAGKRKLFFIYL